MPISDEEFEAVIDEALATLPEDFRSALDNLAIDIADEPAPEFWEKGRLLLGLYQGTPLTKRFYNQTVVFPDQITLFKRPIEQLCRTRAAMIEQIRKTLLHEIGHYFGIDDKRLRELGY